MNQAQSLSRRSILRVFPAAAVTAAAVVFSAQEALAKDKPKPLNQEQPAEAAQAVHGHRAIIGML